VRWSDRWRALLDDASPKAALRASRGRAYERSGRVTDLRATPGQLSGRVQGSRATPYLVELGVPLLDQTAWGQVVRAVADQVRHGARLSSGQAPQGLEDELEAEGVRLFPHPAEMAPSCGCDDGSPWCKHVAAVVEATARRLDDDPFLLLRLRGRGRERFLADLAAVRTGAAQEQGWDVAGVPPAEWAVAPIPLDQEREALPAGEDVLTGLGDPSGWAGGMDAASLFGPLVDRGAAWAARQTPPPPS
jgi:uncharacterized Zn finger protein